MPGSHDVTWFSASTPGHPLTEAARENYQAAAKT
jgi:hypothetical protein